MGCDYNDDAPPIELKMQLVEIYKISNGIICQCDGQMISSKKFDKAKRQSGYIGYFAKAILPDVPVDKFGLFT